MAGFTKMKWGKAYKTTGEFPSLGTFDSLGAVKQEPGYDTLVWHNSDHVKITQGHTAHTEV